MSTIVREGFFAFNEDISSPGDAFAVFGATHLIALALAVLLCAGLCVFARRQSRHGQWLLMRVLVLVVTGLEIVRQTSFVLVHGHYWFEHLPLHMCGLILFVEAVHFSQPMPDGEPTFVRKFTGEIIYALGLLGAVMAMLFPDWTGQRPVHFYPLQSFTVHTLHITIAVLLLATKNYVPNPKNIWMPAVFLAVILPPIYVFNLRTGTNFFFLNAGSAGSPLEILIDIFGNPWFLLPYLGLLAVGWTLMYLPWRRRARMMPDGCV